MKTFWYIRLEKTVRSYWKASCDKHPMQRCPYPKGAWPPVRGVPWHSGGL